MLMVLILLDWEELNLSNFNTKCVFFTTSKLPDNGEWLEDYLKVIWYTSHSNIYLVYCSWMHPN